MEKENQNLINEEIKKFNKIVNYNIGGKEPIITERSRQPYTDEGVITEAEPGEEEETEEFDFGAEEGGGEEPATEEGGEEPAAEEGGEENADFDFGGEGSPEGGEEPAAEEDEFGTASGFSASDDLESTEDEEVEEIDVTAIVQGSDEAKEMAQQAVSVGQENTSYLQSLTDKLSNLEAQLSKMDSIASKITKIEQDIKTPQEKLELRSLDSYPFNTKLSDYWEEKSKDDRYRVSTGEQVSNGETKEYVLTPEELNADYSEEEVKNTFNPLKNN
tara:strand:+ start:1280 stop:2101 length:822 start_codon:yes stop_codon:yes gene_type:complete